MRRVLFNENGRPEVKRLLTIAASDPSGGAGIQKDLQVFCHFGMWGASALTGLTVQDGAEVQRVEAVSAELLIQQIRASGMPDGIKIGALCSPAQIEPLGEFLATLKVPVVADPVFAPTNGAPFLNEDCAAAYRKHILAHATVVTPNIPEAELLGLPESGDSATVYITGGHSHNELGLREVLHEKGTAKAFVRPRYYLAYSHGTGCTFSSALLCCLVRGLTLVNACERAAKWTSALYRKINRELQQITR